MVLERKKFFEKRGFKIEKRRREGRMGFEKIIGKDKEIQRREMWEKIRGSKYNKWYGEVKGEEIPGYLKKGWGESR